MPTVRGPTCLSGTGLRLVPTVGPQPTCLPPVVGEWGATGLLLSENQSRKNDLGPAKKNRYGVFIGMDMGDG